MLPPSLQPACHFSLVLGYARHPVSVLLALHNGSTRHYHRPYCHRRPPQERYVVVAGGALSYFPTAQEFEQGAEPLKSLHLPLRYYAVDP
jgi:hypothetical protein